MVVATSLSEVWWVGTRETAVPCGMRLLSTESTFLFRTGGGGRIHVAPGPAPLRLHFIWRRAAPLRITKDYKTPRRTPNQPRGDGDRCGATERHAIAYLTPDCHYQDLTIECHCQDLTTGCHYQDLTTLLVAPTGGLRPPSGAVSETETPVFFYLFFRGFIFLMCWCAKTVSRVNDCRVLSYVIRCDRSIFLKSFLPKKRKM